MRRRCPSSETAIALVEDAPVEDASHEESLLEDALRLRLAVGRLQRRIRVDAGGSTPPLQLAVLWTLGKEGPLGLTQIARREGVTVPTISRAVEALASNGLIVRACDDNDGRRTSVRLTASGRALLAEVLTRRTAYLRRRVAALSHDDREAIRRALPLLETLLEHDVGT